MTLPTSGPLSIGDINVEKGLARETADSSLETLSTTDINPHSVLKPDGISPHKISEFYGYDHNASP